jgi:hypothetical protein
VGFNVIRPSLQSGDGSNIGLTDQKRGFGFLHDGSVSLTEFLAAPVFNSTTQQERDLFAFAMAFPTSILPAVGAQQLVNNTNKNDSAVTTTINTLIAQAEALACDVIVKGRFAGIDKGYAYDRNSNNFVPDQISDPNITESALRASVQAGDVIVYMGVPRGAGTRSGIDRDRDAWPDRSETGLGYDPADPNSNPWGFTP